MQAFDSSAYLPFSIRFVDVFGGKRRRLSSHREEKIGARKRRMGTSSLLLPCSLSLQGKWTLFCVEERGEARITPAYEHSFFQIFSRFLIYSFVFLGSLLYLCPLLLPLSSHFFLLVPHLRLSKFHFLETLLFLVLRASNNTH